ncbi:MAG: signal recognition particle-docking protein FtsY [Candidatus Diapherotrites archaeon]|nr:signal recognition particle-docking protein FtsY [Candidatus Diapherotrites archaeon]
MPSHEAHAIPGTLEEELAEPAEELHEAAEPHDIKGRELQAKVSLGGKLKSFFTGTVTVSEKEISGLLEDLELALLEADVEPDTAERVCAGIKKELSGKKIDGNRFEEAIKAEIRKSLLETMAAESIDICAMAKSKAEKPFVILFLGPNGAGKTTTIAKIAHYLKKRGLESILAASDTFRAASIEQIGVHAERLGLRVVKHNYGSDPAAVAFDAVQAAKAKGIPVVLVDSAGRQETNKNLMKEIEKIVRVVKPDLKLFVGEALAGHSLIEQAREFDKTVGLDGFVLTKIDTDAKGGTTISLIYNLKKPVVFIGTGQGYDDMLEFRPEFIVDRAVA